MSATLSGASAAAISRSSATPTVASPPERPDASHFQAFTKAAASGLRPAAAAARQPRHPRDPPAWTPAGRGGHPSPAIPET
eukprot:2734801-Pyramimonas_sp.AAC.1